MTPAERNLVELGEEARMRDVRMIFQHATERDFIDAVEGIFGREVRAFVSGIDVRHDVSSEVFYFKPAGTTMSPALNGESQDLPADAVAAAESQSR